MRVTNKTVYSTVTDQDINLIRVVYGLPEFSRPAVVAKRGGEIVGVIGSHYPDGLHVAGPFVADSSVIALRLSLLYEELLRQAGMETYVFSVKTDNPWIRIVRRMNFIRLSDDGRIAWFKRDLACRTIVTAAN
jgi:hypothetical protein